MYLCQDCVLPHSLKPITLSIASLLSPCLKFIALHFSRTSNISYCHLIPLLLYEFPDTFISAPILKNLRSFQSCVINVGMG